MIISLRNIVTDHRNSLRNKTIVRDKVKAEGLQNTQPVRVTIKQRKDGTTTTNTYFAGN